MQGNGGLELGRRPVNRSRVRVIVSGLLIVLSITARVEPAAAHGELLQASPGPGQRAGGVVDFIDLAFLQEATDVVVEVTRDGAPVAGVTTVASGRIVRFAFDQPLTEPGRYDVTFTASWMDEDRISEAYYFTYLPDAPAPVHIGAVPTSSQQGGWSIVQIVATVVLVTSMLGLAFLYIVHLERRRSRAADLASDPSEN